MIPQDEFVQFLVDTGALKFGSFTTKSGRNTPYFINTGEFRTGKALSRLASFYARTLVEKFGDEPDNLFGPAYKGIPLCAATAMSLSDLYGRSISFTYNRKEAKDHGEGGLLVGDDYSQPRRIVIIEDVITAGTSVRETISMLKSLPNAHVMGLLVSVDRREKLESGLSALGQVEKEFGLKTASIIRIDHIIEYLGVPNNRKLLGLGESILDEVKTYRDQWGALE